MGASDRMLPEFQLAMIIVIFMIFVTIFMMISVMISVMIPTVSFMVISTAILATFWPPDTTRQRRDCQKQNCQFDPM
jgi:uncharacterized RDD family membrane protein YckC